jgi:hypothetical protein
MSEKLDSRYGVDPYLDWVARKASRSPRITASTCSRSKRDVAALRREGRRRASEGPRRLHQHVPARHSAGRFDDAAASSLRGRLLRARGARARRRSSSRMAQAQLRMGPQEPVRHSAERKHRHFNGSGRERALLVTTTDLPLVMNTFHNEKFVFENDFDFNERAGKQGWYSGEGDLITVAPATTCGRRTSFPISRPSS